MSGFGVPVSHWPATNVPDRGCLELSVSGPRQPSLGDAARGAAQNGSRNRLEGANSPVRPLPSAHRRRQKRPLVIAAIAREMAAFLWAIAQHVAPAA